MNTRTISRIRPLLLAALPFFSICAAHGGKEIEVPVIAADGTMLGPRSLTLDERAWHLKFSADGQSLYAVADSIYQIDWRARLAKPIWQKSDRETMDRAVFSPDGSHFARMENGNRIHLHESAGGKLLQTITGSAERAFDAAAWSPDSSRIAIGGRGEILIHRVDSGALQQRILQGSTDITALAWSPDGKWIAAINRGNAPEDRQTAGFSNISTKPLGACPATNARGDRCHESPTHRWQSCDSPNCGAGLARLWADP